MATRTLLVVILSGFALGATAESPAPPVQFGAAITLRDATPLSEVMAAPGRYAEGPVLLRGRLTDLCQKKGCWTVLEDEGAVVRVRFHDYGFFLPSEALGRIALVEGVAQVRTLSEEEARHLASESRSEDPGKIEGPRREVGFVATGVRLLESN